MHKLLEFLAQKKVTSLGVAIAVLASPFLYIVIASVIQIIPSVDTTDVSISTANPFIQIMIGTSIFGFAIIIISRICVWILAFQKLKSLRKSK